MRTMLLLLGLSVLVGCEVGPVTVDPPIVPVEGDKDGGKDDAGQCLPSSMCTDGFVLCVECSCSGQICGYTEAVDDVFDFQNIKGTKGEGVCRDDGSCAPIAATPNWDPCPSALCAEIGF